MAHQSDVGFRFEADGRTLDVVRFELTEGVSESFQLQVELSSSDDALDALEWLDREAHFVIERGGRPERTVVGVVTAFEQRETGFTRTRYAAVIESPLARLALRQNSRIFQQVNAPQILATLLKDHRLIGTRTVYAGNYEPREYAVQYNEADRAFLHRLATQEGIVYWHEVEQGHGRLVLCDRIERGPVLEGAVLYQPTPSADAPTPHLWHFGHRRQLAPTRVTQRDYTFHNPRYDLQHEARPWSAERAIGEYEHFDYPGRYKADALGKPFTRTKLAGLRNQAEHARIAGDDARLFPGVAFDLTGHPNEGMNAPWRVIAMRHSGEQFTSQEEGAAQAEQGVHYRYEATVVPAHFDWKPVPAPRPRVDGPQVAQVVGPPNEEIFVDPHGRVQVYFPWDRESQRTEGSTCWIRVAQGWAGPMYGFMAIPRINHEVLVSFMDGDPDQPVLTGTTYHAANRPPYELPLHKTRTTFKTKSHKAEGYNELRFEDEGGREEIFIHAQKDRNLVIENDETTNVGHDRSEDVGNDETIQIARNRTESVGNDETITIGQDRFETLGQDHAIEVRRLRQVTIHKDLLEDVGNTRTERTAADRTVETGGHEFHRVEGRHDTEAGERIHQTTRSYVVEASERITVSAAGGTITIDADGVELDGFEHLVKGPFNRSPVGQGNHFTIEGHLLPPIPLDVDCPFWGGAAAVPAPAAFAESHEAPASDSSPAPAGGGVGAINNGSTSCGEEQGAPRITPPATAFPGPSTSAPHVCQWRIPSITQRNCRMSMESADYYMLDPKRTRMKDIEGNDVLLRYGGGSGTFDLTYDEVAKEIVATVRVLMTPKDIVELDPTTNAEKVDANGARISVPFDHDVHRDKAPTPNRLNKIVPRTSVGIDLQVTANGIESTLNKNQYRLTIDGCSQGSACSCQIPVRFAVELQDNAAGFSRPPHRTVNLFPMASRANSGNWGEANVVKHVDPTTGISSWTPSFSSGRYLVAAHEIGHLFSWPDEYWEYGGACHMQYIKNQNIDFTAEPPLLGTDTWQLYSAADLMGGGTSRPTALTPPYYVFRIRDWFNKRTGKSWKVIQ